MAKEDLRVSCLFCGKGFRDLLSRFEHENKFCSQNPVLKRGKKYD